jgi:hypothetical protein
MPYRTHLSTITGTVFEGVVLGILAITNGCKYIAAMIADDDWQKMTGPYAFLFGLIIAVVVLWNSGRVREKNENTRRAAEAEAREKQNAETLTLQKDNSQKLLDLTAESIKAHGMSVGAIKSMDRTIQSLTLELGDRPCWATKRKVPFPRLPDHPPGD